MSLCAIARGQVKHRFTDHQATTYCDIHAQAKHEFGKHREVSEGGGRRLAFLSNAAGWWLGNLCLPLVGATGLAAAVGYR
jgi:hypothetical protein